MAGRLIGNGSANSSTVASPSAKRRTIERRVGSDNAAKTTSNRSGAITVIAKVAPADTSQDSYLTHGVNTVKRGVAALAMDSSAHRPLRTRAGAGANALQDRSRIGELSAVHRDRDLDDVALVAFDLH